MFKYGVSSKFFSQEDADQIIEKFKKLDNVIFSDHITKPLENDVLAADVVISDGTSALGEVIVTDKPIIYLSNGWNNEFESNDLAKELKKFLYFAHDPLEIIMYLNNIRALGYTPFNNNIPIKNEESWKSFKKRLDPVEDPASFIASYIEELENKH
ncbi:MAG: hypothetical protein LN588_03060 [Rickettsia endosymbiont of Bryobia graminum]|nr:hypothetical protein [Rickettsia endosymbiont of Bryobia graminum]